MTIDTRDVKELGLAKFRTQADNGTKQICYYNRNKKDTCFNSFLAVRKQTSSPFEINFSIVKVIHNINRQNVIYSEISDELSDFKKGNVVQRPIQRISEINFVRDITGRRDGQTDRNLQVMDESAKSQDFFQDNNTSAKIGKRYTTTRIKSRNFLSKIAYVGINKEDYYNENFIFDVYVRVTNNLNPFSLDRKLADKNKHEVIYMLWKECMPPKFYKHICKEKNFLYLNGKNVLQPKVLEIINDFLQENENNYKELRNNLCSYRNIFQYMYSNVFPEIYCSTEKRGFDLKSNFHIIFKTYKDKKKIG